MREARLESEAISRNRGDLYSAAMGWRSASATTFSLVGFVCAHGDALEFLELAEEEILDQVPPFVEFGIERQRQRAPRMLEDDDFCSPLVQFGDDVVAVKGLVGDDAAKFHAIDQRRDADRIEAMAGQENETNEIAERIGQRQDFSCHAALGTADRLALRPPFAPCPFERRRRSENRPR